MRGALLVAGVVCVLWCASVREERGAGTALERSLMNATARSPRGMNRPSIELPARAGGVVHVSADRDAWIDLVSEGVDDVAAETRDGVVTYRTHDVRIVWGATPSAVEELRVLDAPRSSYAWTLAARVGDAIVSARVREHRVELLDSSGYARLQTAPVFAEDARGVRRDVTMTLEGNAPSFRIHLAVDLRGLQAPIAIDPAWAKVAPLSVPRYKAAAAPIALGKIVVTGGQRVGEVYTTEVYDPAANTWTTVSPLLRFCEDGAAAPLPDGRALFVAFPNAQVFNPSTGGFTLTGNTITTRNRYSLVSLADGRVLMTGGVVYGGTTDVTATAEIYDPASNTWTATAPMSAKRYGHAATLLGSGKVLVAGGSTCWPRCETSSAEVFDPVSSTWTVVGSLPAPRVSHVAIALPDGRAIVSGHDSSAADSSSEVFDPTSGSFASSGATSGDGILPAGGQLLGRAAIVNRSNVGNPQRLDVFDPVRGWSFAGAINELRLEPTIVVAGSRLYAIGGRGELGTLASVEVFDPRTNGTACSSGGECASFSCVEATCCATPSCASGTTCAGPGNAGSCHAIVGRACTTSSECASGFCTDGVCCNVACSGQCEACNVSGKLGTCAPIAGAPRGTRAACSGTAPGTTCGITCDGNDGSKCNYVSKTTPCSADSCTDGVETHAGFCDGSGACGATPPRTCGAYRCSTLACRTACVAPADCAKRHTCRGSLCVPLEGLGRACTNASDCATGACVDGACCASAVCAPGSTCAAAGKAGTCMKNNGTACAANDECASGVCTDGVCCDRACNGQCEACDVAGKIGACAVVSGPPHGTRAACAASSEPCAARSCDGKDATSCAGFSASSAFVCKKSSCAGDQFTGDARCDGSGACKSPEPTSCVPYRCTELGCATSCGVDDDCADGFGCTGGTCKPATARCTADALSSRSKDGAETSCVAYRCDRDVGTCRTSCSETGHCAPGFYCDVAAQTCIAPQTAIEEDDSGCTMGRRTRGFGSWLALLVGIAIIARRRSILLALALLGCGRERTATTADPWAPIVRAIGEPALLHAASTPRGFELLIGPRRAGSAGFSFIGATLSVTIPRRADGALRIERADRDDLWIELTPLDVGNAVANIDPRGAMFRGPSQDLSYVRSPSGIEELRVLHEARVTTLAWRTRVGPGVADLRVREGRIEVIDRHARTFLTSEPLFAVDARGVRVRPIAALHDEQLEITLDARGLTAPIVVDPVWTSTSHAELVRSKLTATLLPDGMVLIAGGGGAMSFTTQWLFDPTTDTIVSAGTTAHRNWPGAALVAGPSVLLGGGYSFSGLVTEAVLYDVTTKTWSPAGTMTVGQQESTAVPLTSGKVLFVGSTTAELWDPTSKTFSAAVSPASSHPWNGAVLLANGKVLAVGTPSEVYDPIANTWSTVTGGGNHDYGASVIALSSGRVLWTGGTEPNNATGAVFDAATSTFSPTKNLTFPRAGIALAKLPSGRVLGAGGIGASVGLTYAEVFDESTGAWTAASAMLARRTGARAVTLNDGRVLVVGGEAIPAIELFTEGKLGTTCGAAGDCQSLACVDGVCCASSSCATGESCAVGGTCKKVRGRACTMASECATGNCIDGVCCDGACTGQCEACDVAGSVGTCSAVSGVPRGIRAACGGAGVGTVCGARCDGVSRTTCTFTSASTLCGADRCADGVETRTGTCNGAGTCAITTASCGTFACGTIACRTTCTINADCAAGHQCKGSTCVPLEGLGTDCTSGTACTTGHCVDGVCCATASCVGSCALAGHKGTCALVVGSACTVAGECGTGHCVDGRCCDAACDGQCEACDVAGALGTCSPIGAAPHGARAACDAGSGKPCTARSCDGARDRKTCAAFAEGPTTTCAAPRCNATKFFPASTCDGAGTCAVAPETNCAPYRCDASGCRTMCRDTDDCADDFVCKSGACVPGGAACDPNGVTVITAEGAKIECAPYKCRSDATCGTSCSSTDECSGGTVCSVAEKVCRSPTPAPEDGGGCAIAPPGSSAWSFAPLALLAAIATCTRRRRS